MDGKDKRGGSSGYSEKSGSKKDSKGIVNNASVTRVNASKTFKGIEQFLRRIALNLGNTPSQTEVKIISCIPIDVTDLQQKIISLENQLATLKPCPGPEPPKRIVNQALHDNTLQKNTTENIETGSSVNTFDLTHCNFYPGFQNCSQQKSIASVPLSSHSVGSITSKQACSSSFRDESRFLDMLSCEKTMKSSKKSDPKQRTGRKSFFGKRKKQMKKNLKTQYVYYAQAGSSPFNRYDPIETTSTTDMIMTRSYLADMVGKQYKPDRFEINLSDISKFSSPVCRDSVSCSARPAYEPDVLSFCQGPFQNVDHHVTESDHYRQLYNINDAFDAHGYYDSAFYDVVPVKEKPAKVKKTIDKKTLDMLKKIEVNSSIDIKCWPGDVRTKLHTHPVYDPLHYGHHSRQSKPDPGGGITRKINKQGLTAKKIIKRRHETHTTDNHIEVETSKSCCVNIGNIYPTPAKKTMDKSIKVALKPAKTDAECLTTVTNNNECQTTASAGDGTGSSSNNEKTEETLNQIKNILQSVLREVKDNSFSNAKSNDYQKRDANIQKGDSLANVPNTFNLQGNIPDSCQSYLPSTVNSGPQSNMNGSFQNNLSFTQNSRLLNSFSYSPFNVPSTSRPFTNTPYAYIPQTAQKCFQHFPLFFQYPGRQMCTCYRHGAQGRGRGMKQPTTTATNTDEIKEEHSKETQKLIKEIYKSMALTVGGFNKHNNSLTEYELKPDFANDTNKPTKKVIEKPQVMQEVKKVTNVVQAVSELFRKRDLPVSSESPNMTAESRPESNEVSTRTTTDDKFRKERLKTFLKESKHSQTRNSRTIPKRKMQCTGTQNTMTGSTSDSETSNITNTESEATIVPQPPLSKPVKQTKPIKKEKRNLLSKMFQSVKLFIPKERQKKEEKGKKVIVSENVASSSDSDDYSTVYSQKIKTAKRNISRPQEVPKRIVQSKITHKQLTTHRERRPEKTNRRIPYMEQEYRRYWDEKLMYQDKHSMGYHGNGKVPYYRTYEARAALVEPARKTSRNRYETRLGMDKRHSEKHKTKIVEEPCRKSPRPCETRVETVIPVKAKPKIKSSNTPKVVQLHPRKGLTGAKISMAIKGSKGLSWLKKHKLGIRCGADQWKQLILEG